MRQTTLLCQDDNYEDVAMLVHFVVVGGVQLLGENIADPHRDFYVGIVQDTFLAKDTFHIFCMVKHPKASDLMDKMGEHTATPERAITLQKIGGLVADTCF